MVSNGSSGNAKRSPDPSSILDGGVPGDPAALDAGHAGLVEKANYLRILQQLAMALLGVSRLDEILWVVARTAIGGLGFEDCVIYLLDERRETLVQKAAYGPKNPVAEEILDPIEIPVGQGIVGAVAATGCSELVADTRSDGRYILDDQMRLSELAVPIFHDGEVIGVIDSEHPDAGFYDESHREILTTIASMASTKIATAVSIERLSETVRLLEQTQTALHEGERRYRMLYDHHPSMFFTLDEKGIVRSANIFAGEQLGYGVDQLVGRSLGSLTPPEEAGEIAEHLATVLEEPGRLHRWDSARLTRAGEVIRVRETARVVRLTGDPHGSVLVVSEDTTDAYELARELHYQASHDSLTGLYNRREFEVRARRAIEDVQVEAGEHVLCYLDLDQFKVINDTSGHVAGDELLRRLASLLREQLRKSDVIARLGGDEFGVLMHHCSIERASELAGGAIEAISAYQFQWGERVFRLGGSVGLVSINRNTESLSDVLACADSACYAAKEAGRNRVHVYSVDDEKLVERDREMRWAVRISEALEHDQFTLYYQPIRSVVGGAGAGSRFEILVRLVDDRDVDTVTLPGSFLPAAERYGLSPDLDRWVLTRTLAWLEDNPLVLEGIAMCSVNLSGLSLDDDRFMEFASRAIEASNVPAGKICFEITETTAVGNLVTARTFIESMKALGCCFALDDFGSGLSSFAYLKSLPVDVLKIDGAFIRSLARSPVDQEIVRSIRGVASVMGMRTVGEFVGDEATLDVLADLGVDYAQGNHISAPRPLDELAAPAGACEIAS